MANETTSESSVTRRTFMTQAGASAAGVVAASALARNAAPPASSARQDTGRSDGTRIG
ncbi:MAG: hypothetical protein JWO87_42 [Phycisphaerales bacterium]|nr:hypothetical protein [Phycisphaerales bacterium]